MALTVRAEYSVFKDRVSLHFFDGKGEKAAVARPLVFDVIEFGEFSEPAVSIKKSEAQELMDELWRVGLRPSEGSGSAGSLAATERHLKDMQKIAIGLLKKDGVDV